jgi:hypothetical protein
MMGGCWVISICRLFFWMGFFRRTMGGCWVISIYLFVWMDYFSFQTWGMSLAIFSSWANWILFVVAW